MNKRLYSVALLGALLSACDGDIKPFEDALIVQQEQLRSLQIENVKPVMDVGEQVQLRVVATNAQGQQLDYTQRVEWHATANGVVSVRDALIQGDSIGTSVLSARFSHLSDSANITVSGAQLSGLRLSAPGASVRECSQTALTATGLYDDATERDESLRVTWQASGTGVSISSTGLLSARDAGQATVQAQLNGISAEPLDLPVDEGLAELSVQPSSFDIRAGETQQLSAQGRYSDGSSANVTQVAAWQFNGNSAVLSVDAQGLVTASAVGVGAVQALCGGLTGLSQARIEAAATVQSIDINDGDNPVEVTLGDNVRLTLEARLTDGTTRDVREDATWEVVSGSEVLRVDNDDDRGRLTLLQAGSASVRATYDNQDDQIEVIVSAQ